MNKKSPQAASGDEPAQCPRCDGPITGPHDFKNNQGEPGPCPWEEDGKRPSPDPSLLLVPSLHVEAGRDCDGNRLVYLPCLFCGVVYGRPHRMWHYPDRSVLCPGEGRKHSAGVGGHLLAQVPDPKEASS